jgi:ADP-heptose:LPS heptosyltransferase
MATRFRWIIKKLLRLLAHSLHRRQIRFARIDHPRIAYWIAGGMGDAIMAMPALAFLKKNFPRSIIDVFVPPDMAPLLADLMRPFSICPVTLKNVVVKTALRFGYSLFFTNTIGTFRLRYEIAGRLSSRYSAGFRYPAEAPVDRIYDFSLSISETSHDSDQNLKLVAETIGVPFEEAGHAGPPVDARHTTRRSSKIVSILVHPGAGKGYERKLWPRENYRSLIERFGEIGCRATVLLGPDEVGHYPFFAAINGIAICHSHNPALLIKTVRAADLFIGNDSGPAHAAALFGVPTITLFGPTNPVRIAPRGENAIIVANATACAPCHFSNVPCDDNKCMKSITVDQVWKEVVGMVHLPKR